MLRPLPVTKARKGSSDLHELYADVFALSLLAPRESVRKITPDFNDVLAVSVQFGLPIPHAQQWLDFLKMTDNTDRPAS